MTERACDMCGDEVVYLYTLTCEYQQDRISEICSKCQQKTNELLFSCAKAQTIQRTNFVRRFMKKIRNTNADKFSPTAS